MIRDAGVSAFADELTQIKAVHESEETDRSHLTKSRDVRRKVLTCLLIHSLVNYSLNRDVGEKEYRGVAQPG